MVKTRSRSKSVKIGLSFTLLNKDILGIISDILNDKEMGRFFLTCSKMQKHVYVIGICMFPQSQCGEGFEVVTLKWFDVTKLIGMRRDTQIHVLQMETRIISDAFVKSNGTLVISNTHHDLNGNLRLLSWRLCHELTQEYKEYLLQLRRSVSDHEFF